MHYYSNPPFHTQSWIDLWRANIPNQESLKNHATSPVIFVAIDTEPRGGNGAGIYEIEISFLAPVGNQLLYRPTSLETLHRHYNIHTTCIQVARRKKGQKHCELVWDGEPTLVQAEDVGRTVIDVLIAIPPTLLPNPPSPSPVLVLVGFSLLFEIQVLSACPGLLQCFSSCVDLQEITMQSSNISTTPSLRDTLLALGFKNEFKNDRPAIIVSSACRHNAGTIPCVSWQYSSIYSRMMPPCILSILVDGVS